MDSSSLSLLLPEPYSYKILQCDGTFENFTACIRCNLVDPKKVKPWVEKFGEEINCNFVSGESRSQKQAKVYKTFPCHLSTKNKSRPAVNLSATPDLTQRNFACNASIKVWIMNDDEEYAVKGFPCRIDIDWKHTHTLNSAHFLSLLRPLKETKVHFEDYFIDGHSVGSAIAAHEKQLQSSTSSHAEAAKMRASKAYNPNRNIVSHWYQDWRRRRFGDWLKSYDAIIENEKSITANGTILVVVKEPFSVLLVTPMMQRAHQLPSASDIIFVDSTTTCDSENHSITFMLAQTCVGAVPVAVFITSDQTEKSYTSAFSLLKSALPETAFGGKGQPKLFLTDDAIAEKKALHAVWPGSDLKNCIFHMAQAQWRWLWEAKNKIKQDHRKPIMDDFRKIMFSSTENDANDAMKAAIVNMKKLESKDYLLGGCIGRLQHLWERRIDWVIAYRDHHSRGNFTNNFAEITMRIFKENILSRRKSYNAASLTDVICTELEERYRTRLLDFAHCRNNSPFLRLDGLMQKAAYITAEMIHAESDDIYSVRSEKGDTIYKLDTAIGLCSCVAGKFGKFCKHAAGVMKFYERSFTNRPPVTYYDRHRMAVVALGTDAEQPHFYRAMNESIVLNEPSTSTAQDEQPMDMEFPQPQHYIATIRKEKIDPIKAKNLTERLLQNLLDNTDNEALAKVFNQFNDKFMSKCDGHPTRLTTLLGAASLSIGKKRNAGAQIPRQHFAASRRKPLVTKGTTTSAAGRVANALRQKAKCGRVPRQKEHNLSRAVKESRPNAKGHS